MWLNYEEHPMNRLKPNHRGVDLRLAQDQKQFIRKKTHASGIFREITLILPGLSEVIAAKLVELMGKDGLKCLKSSRPSFEISVLLYGRYLKFLESNDYKFNPPMEVRRESLRRGTPGGLSQDDIDRISKLLRVIFKDLPQQKVDELSRIIIRPALNIIWSSNPLLPLKQFCLEHHKKWLTENGIDAAKMTEELKMKRDQIEKPRNKLSESTLKPQKKSKKRMSQFG